LKINLFIPFVTQTGGIAVVAEYYLQLTKLGHSVRIYYPMIPYSQFFSEDYSTLKILFIISKYFIKKLFLPVKRLTWYHESVSVKPVVLFKNVFIRNADISVATAWPTAYDVNRLSPKKGKKFYLVQGFEVWAGKKNDVLATYQFPLNMVTISPWLTNQLRQIGCTRIVDEVFNGVRLDKFYPAPKKSDSISILLICSEIELKGTREAISAIEQLTIEFPDLNIIMFGMIEKPHINIPVTYYKNPTHEQILSCYQNANIFISPSHFEGWGLPIMEAMACKCAVLATRTGCIPLIYNGKNLVIIRSQSPQSIVRGCKLLILDSARRERCAEEGYKSILNFNWETSAKKLETLFLDSVQK
jgi:glycosyltransferase involved in cell wall biosynthesis